MPVLSTRVQWIQMVYSHQQQETGNGLQATIHCAYIYIYIYIYYIYIYIYHPTAHVLISAYFNVVSTARMHESRPESIHHIISASR